MAGKLAALMVKFHAAGVSSSRPELAYVWTITTSGVSTDSTSSDQVEPVTAG